MKKIVIAIDSYKGCLSSAQVADSVAEGILQQCPDAQVVKVPVADGGEGTVEALAREGDLVRKVVSDPLGRPTEAVYGISGDTAIIEVAAACGLDLLKDTALNVLDASTKGVGELIADAISRGCRRFLIGLGGSATNDGGKGMVEVPGLLEEASSLEFTAFCDVDTPFVGPEGASRVFAPQKGATPEMVEILEERMLRWAAEILERTAKDIRYLPGAGAAGGLGGALYAFFGAKLCRGVDVVLDTIDFDRTIRGADLVITGEGRSDFQTPKGKTPSGVLERAKKQGIRVALLSGAFQDCPELRSMGFCSLNAATPAGMPLEQALRAEVARENLRRSGAKLMREIF